ncbi:MAG TPA: DNA polymerase/3'-5' exonuclease PolX [Anaerolineae bacterium]|nr:DNA polymerase/3'-5' exonuclease PolX [Anaerolineae bacterium]
MNNREVAEVFQRIADLLEIKGEEIYRVLAYRRASDTVRSLGESIEAVWRDGRLEEIPGVGKAISGKIDELLRTGRLEFYEKLTTEIPPSLIDLLHVGDVGPKKAARFWKELGITSLDDLEAAAKAGRLKSLRGMGERSEKRILESLEALKLRQTDRILINQAWEIAADLVASLGKLPGVEKAEVAGSLRRWRETVGDLDLIAASSDASSVMNAFLSLPQISRIVGRGETKLSVELHNGLRTQLWVHPPSHFGTALQYATGSQAHNVRLRELAKRSGLSLSEHGFMRQDGSEITCEDEEEVYRILGLPWIPAELREDRGEVEAALEDRLPKLITQNDLVGELHSHSDWSDGSCTLEEMVRAAQAFGLQYLAITDHSQSLGVARGLDVDRLRQQREAINEIQQAVGDDIRVLQGIEVEILADGRMDYSDEVLSELDLVIASLHTSLRQPRHIITARLLKAIRNPHVDMIAHPTGRLVGSRDPADLDMEAIFETAAEHQVVLSINASPERLDLSDVHARRAMELGCLLAVNTDAHHPEHLVLQQYGVGVARRAWVESGSVINCWPYDRVHQWLRARG